MNALLVICGLGVFSLIAEILNLKRWLIAVVMAGLAAAAGLVILDFGTDTSHYSGMLQFNNFSLAFSGLIILTTLFWFWMANDYFQDTHLTDRTALVIFTVAGALMLTSFSNMAMLFLGVEVLSISLYVLAGSRKDSLFSTEAAFKYFLMGSFATGFLLMGITLTYGATGSFDLNNISVYLAAHGHELPVFFYAGVLMMMVGLAFKISAVPFHFWAPDVYEGSPTVITAFMSTVVKIGAIAAFYRIFALCFSVVEPAWVLPLQVIAVLTLVIANITAVYQSNTKRMLAYSSIGHVGYILLAFVANSSASSETIFYYLATYAASSIAAFTVLFILENNNQALSINSFNGLFKKNPLLAVSMTLALLSLAGIPPLPGFFAKYMVFALAIESGNTPFVIVAIVTSLIGVYYYFRILIAMYFQEPQGGDQLIVTTSHRILIYVLIAISVGLGIFAEAVLEVIR